jgi:hypothetical protein
MIKVTFKYDNRDYVKVTGTEDSSAAYEAAEDFLAGIGDAETDYCLDHRHFDQEDDGSFEFKVKAYDK